VNAASRSEGAPLARPHLHAIAAHGLGAIQRSVGVRKQAVRDGLQIGFMPPGRNGRYAHRHGERALDLPATELPLDTAAWPGDDPALCMQVEDRVARELGLEAGELFLDFPAKPDMLKLDLPLVKRDGSVTQLAGADATAHLGLPRVAGELYRTARRLRVFVLRPVDVPLKAIVDLIMLPGAEVAARIAAERSLVSAARG